MRELPFQNSMLARCLFVIATLILVFLLPWWFVLAVSLLGIFFFYPFPEFLLPGILFDILYGTHGSLWNIARHTIIFLAVFIVLTFIRSRLRL